MYDPNAHDDPIVLASTDTWADPVHVPPADLLDTRVSWRDGRLRPLRVEFDESEKPINPYPNNGNLGRGLLVKWGPNHTANPIVTRQANGKYQLLIHQRTGPNERILALPGGMVDVDPLTGKLEAVTTTLRRILVEEAIQGTGDSATLLLDAIETSTRVVYAGYAEDPRNTRNAWIETYVAHVHVPEAVAEKLVLHTDETKGTQWMDLTMENIEMLYGDHKTYVLYAMHGMLFPMHEARPLITTFSIVGVVLLISFVIFVAAYASHVMDREIPPHITRSILHDDV